MPFIFVILALLAVRLPLHAQTAVISLTPGKTEVAAGEVAVIKGAARIPEKASLEFVETKLEEGENDKSGPFSVLKVSLGAPSVRDGYKEIPITIETAAFELGEQTFPALRWRLKTAGTSDQSLKSPPIRFQVTAPEAEGADADIRDLKPPVRPFPWPLLVWVLLSLGLAAALWVFWPRSETEARSRMPLLPPHEEALARLLRLEESGLWESGSVKEFHVELAEVLRDYMERRFDMSARTSTTSALAKQLRLLEIDASACRWTRELLGSCDLVKFARWRPEVGGKNSILSKAREIVAETTPKAAQPPATGVLQSDGI